MGRSSELTETESQLSVLANVILDCNCGDGGRRDTEEGLSKDPDHTCQASLSSPS
jgi:hypothetical protein